MKNICIAGLGLALSVVLFNACKTDHSKHHTAPAETSAPGTQYICPMNCEKGKTYDQPGSCPVCHMTLEPVKAAVEANKSEYFTAFVATPAPLEAGKPALLSFTPKIRGNESVPVPLDLVHEKKMHLILVSDDLSWFDHIHPEYAASGNYEIKVLGKGASFTHGRGKDETRFDAGGKYWAFTDYKPSGALNQVNKTELNVSGAPARPVVFNREKMRAAVDGFVLDIEPGHGGAGLNSGSLQHLPVSISRDGKPVDPGAFENYLGEKAHLVMVEVDTKEFVHTHPAVENGKLDIHTTFSKPGTYRGWLQFQTEGQVHTADFVLKVAQGTAAGTGHEGHMAH